MRPVSTFLIMQLSNSRQDPTLRHRDLNLAVSAFKRRISLDFSVKSLYNPVFDS